MHDFKNEIMNEEKNARKQEKGKVIVQEYMQEGKNVGMLELKNKEWKYSTTTKFINEICHNSRLQIFKNNKTAKIQELNNARMQ